MSLKGKIRKIRRWKGLHTVGSVMFLIIFTTLCFAGGKKEEPKAAGKKEQLKTEIFEKVGQITVGAQNYYNQSVKPSNLIDKNINTFWHSAPPPGTLGWVSISYPKPFKASEYKICMRPNEPTQAPRDFILEGSVMESFPTNNTDWQIIDEQKQQEWTKDKMHIYKIARPRSFRHYRFRILKTASTEYVSIAEWELKE